MDTKTATYKQLRTYLKEKGIRMQSPTKEQALQAVQIDLDQEAYMQRNKAGKPSKNLGYEAKLALRVARFHPDAPAEKELRKKVSLRFSLFKELRQDMIVQDAHFGEADCAVCGKHHIKDIFDVSLPDGNIIPVGDDCIENIGFVEGDGFFKARKDAATKARVEGALASGSITSNTRTMVGIGSNLGSIASMPPTATKEEVRRYRIKKARGGTYEELPAGL